MVTAGGAGGRVRGSPRGLLSQWGLQLNQWVLQLSQSEAEPMGFADGLDVEGERRHQS